MPLSLARGHDGDAVVDIVKNHFGAYRVGVEYAYTMVHGAPATKFSEYAVPAATAHKNLFETGWADSLAQ
jgi:hypothetical protein